MADKIYGLYPYQWQPPINGRPGYHYRPAGVIGGFDWRPLPSQGTSGQSSGYGFLAFAPGTAPNDLITLGIGDCREIVATPTMRNELRAKLGLSRDPAGAKLVDLVADICGPLSVPDGSTGVKTFMPTRINDYDLHLAGHSKVHSQRINAAELLSNNPIGHANKIRDVLRRRYDATFAEFGLEVTRKMLGEQLIRLGYHKDDVANGAPGKASEWKRLLSPSLANRQGMKPAKPATTNSETWPNVAADVELAAQDHSWESMTGSPISGTPKMSVVAGNKIQPASKGAYTGILCLSAVSSIDHTVSGTIVTLALSTCAALVWCRAQTGLIKGYAAGRQASIFGGDGGRVLSKWFNGVQTLLAQDAGYAGTGPVITVTADGSTITGTCTGEADQVESDSAVSEGVRGVAWLVAGTSQANAQMGAWSISDVATAAGGAGVSAQMLLEGWL